MRGSTGRPVPLLGEGGVWRCRSTSRPVGDPTRRWSRCARYQRSGGPRYQTTCYPQSRDENLADCSGASPDAISMARAPAADGDALACVFRLLRISGARTVALGVGALVRSAAREVQRGGIVPARRYPSSMGMIKLPLCGQRVAVQRHVRPNRHQIIEISRNAQDRLSGARELRKVPRRRTNDGGRLNA